MPCEDDPSHLKPQKYTRLSKDYGHHSVEQCFFCGRSEVRDKLHNVSTFDVDIRVRQCALKLQDKPKTQCWRLKYHAQCNISLYNKARDMEAEVSSVYDVNHGIAFAGLVSFIEEAHKDNLVSPVFKLSDLVCTLPGYNNWEHIQLGVCTPSNFRTDY